MDMDTLVKGIFWLVIAPTVGVMAIGLYGYAIDNTWYLRCSQGEVVVVQHWRGASGDLQRRNTCAAPAPVIRFVKREDGRIVRDSGQ
jgi:hypothetical protein